MPTPVLSLPHPPHPSADCLLSLPSSHTSLPISLSLYAYFLSTPFLPSFCLFFLDFKAGVGGKGILFFLGCVISCIHLPPTLNALGCSLKFSGQNPLSLRTGKWSAPLSNHSGAVSSALGSSESVVVVSVAPDCLGLPASVCPPIKWQ